MRGLEVIRHHARFHFGKVEKRMDQADQPVAFLGEDP